MKPLTIFSCSSASADCVDNLYFFFSYPFFKYHFLRTLWRTGGFLFHSLSSSVSSIDLFSDVVSRVPSTKTFDCHHQPQLKKIHSCRSDPSAPTSSQCFDTEDIKQKRRKQKKTEVIRAKTFVLWRSNVEEVELFKKNHQKNNKVQSRTSPPVFNPPFCRLF